MLKYEEMLRQMHDDGECNEIKKELLPTIIIQKMKDAWKIMMMVRHTIIEFEYNFYFISKPIKTCIAAVKKSN